MSNIVKKNRKGSNKTAKPKTVNNDMAYVFSVREKDVLARENFGSFEVIKFKQGMMFKTYTGFHIFTAPYSVTPEGDAEHNSLYEWLDNLLTMKSEIAGHEDESWDDKTVKEDGALLTRGEMLEQVRIITESNLVMPMVSFADIDKAVQRCVEYMQWLNVKQEELAKAMSAEVPSEEEAIKADAEEAARVERSEMLSDILDESVEHIAEAEEQKQDIDAE